MRSVVVAIALTVSLAAAARGQPAATPPPPHVVDRDGRAAVDWTRGLLIDVGAAAANLRAPSAEVARVEAERVAIERARGALARRVGTLPLADGRTVAEAGPDALAGMAARALVLELDYGADGSTVATLGLPLEAVRLALTGVPEAGALPPEGPTALVVRAGGVLERPALGVTLGAGSEAYAGPTIYHRSRASARADARLGPRPRPVRATGYDDGQLRLATEGPAAITPADLAAARAAGALVVVVLGQ